MDDAPRSGPRVVEWRVHPARRRPFTAAIVVTLVCGLATLGGIAMGPALGWMTWLFAAVLLGSISGFLLPTRYVLDDEGVTIRHAFLARRRPWQEIRRIELGSHAALLSPFREPRALDRWRALLLDLDGAPAAAREILSAHRSV